MIKNNDFNEEYIIWLNSKTPDEEKILTKMCEFEDKYFADLTLKDLKKEFIRWINKTNGRLDKDYDDLLGDKGLSLYKNEWKIKLVKTKQSLLYGWGAACVCKDNLIKIEGFFKDNDSILLHEMIHAYEFMLTEYSNYQQFLVLELYKKLLPKIPDLDRIIKWDIHIKNSVYHSLLFLLKSIDLDLQLMQPLGTIYGYGRYYDLKKFNQYLVRYKIFNKYKSKQFDNLESLYSFATIEEAKHFIKRHQKQRLQNFNTEQEKVNNSKIKPFFKDIMHLPPIEYYIYKKDVKNKFTILIDTIKDEDMKIEHYH